MLNKIGWWSYLSPWCLLLLIGPAACSREKPEPIKANSPAAAKRYDFKGKVVSIDKNAGAANIDTEPIPGFMDAMVMSYTIMPAAALDNLKPGDSITAEVVVEPDKYWLENVTVLGHSPASAGRPGS